MYLGFGDRVPLTELLFVEPGYCYKIAVFWFCLKCVWSLKKVVKISNKIISCRQLICGSKLQFLRFVRVSLWLTISVSYKYYNR